MEEVALKRVAMKRIQATRFRSLFLMHVVFPEPPHTSGRHALAFEFPVFRRRNLRQAGLTIGLAFFPELHYMRRSFAP
ncbi:hypothetical protein MPLA_810038 [Mesorhizobium sp. ORS 3359]|nr:hypothetical protein MPLA_810038 [Mesorhizobium sp. ORS 3359]